MLAHGSESRGLGLWPLGPVGAALNPLHPLPPRWIPEAGRRPPSRPKLEPEFSTVAAPMERGCHLVARSGMTARPEPREPPEPVSATMAVTVMMAAPYQHHTSSQLSCTPPSLCFGQAGPSVPAMIRVISTPKITRISTTDQATAFCHALS